MPPDLRRKALFVLFESGRQAFLKLLVARRTLPLLGAVGAFRARSADFAHRCALPLAPWVLETRAQRFREARYSLATAVAVLCVGRGAAVGLPRALARLPARTDPLEPPAVAPVLARTDAVLRRALLAGDVPRVFTHVAVADGQLVLSVAHEYRVWLHLTPVWSPAGPAQSAPGGTAAGAKEEEKEDEDGDIKALWMPWCVARLDSLVPGALASTNGSGADGWVFRLRDSVNRVLAGPGLRARAPLALVHRALHAVCAALRWDLLCAAAQRLPALFPRDSVRVVFSSGTTTTSSRTTNKSFAIEYWVGGRARRQRHEAPPRVVVAQQADGRVGLAHEPACGWAGVLPATLAPSARPVAQLAALVHRAACAGASATLEAVRARLTERVPSLANGLHVTVDPATGLPCLRVPLPTGASAVLGVAAATGDCVLATTGAAGGVVPRAVAAFLRENPRLADRALLMLLAHSTVDAVAVAVATAPTCAYRLVSREGGDDDNDAALLRFVDCARGLTLTVTSVQAAGMPSPSAQTTFECRLSCLGNNDGDEETKETSPRTWSFTAGCGCADCGGCRALLVAHTRAMLDAVRAREVKTALCGWLTEVAPSGHAAFVGHWHGLRVETRADRCGAEAVLEMPDEMRAVVTAGAKEAVCALQSGAGAGGEVVAVEGSRLRVAAPGATVAEAVARVRHALEFVWDLCIVQQNCDSLPACALTARVPAALALTVGGVPVRLNARADSLGVALPMSLRAYAAACEAAARHGAAVRGTAPSFFDALPQPFPEDLSTNLPLAAAIFKVFSGVLSSDDSNNSGESKGLLQECVVVPRRMDTLRLVFRGCRAADLVLRAPHVLVREYTRWPSLMRVRAGLAAGGREPFAPARTPLAEAPALARYALTVPARRGSAVRLPVLAGTASELPALLTGIVAHFAQDVLGTQLLAALRAEWHSLASSTTDEGSAEGEPRVVLTLAEGAREVAVVGAGSSLRVAAPGAHATEYPLALFAPCLRAPGAVAALARVLAAPWRAASDVLAVYTTYATSTRCRLLLADPAAPSSNDDEGTLHLALVLPPRADRTEALAVPVVYSLAAPGAVRFADSSALAPAARALVERVAKLPGAAALADSLKTLVEWLLAVV